MSSTHSKFSDLLNAFIPKSIRKNITRDNFQICFPLGDLGDIVYKVAETEEEIEQAIELIQDSYAEVDDDDKTFSSLVLTKYNLLPTTTILIAVKDQEVLGTLSLVMETSIGLPIEEVSDISRLKNTGHRLVELSEIAINEKWAKDKSNIFITMTSMAIRYAVEVLGSGFLVSRVNKKAQYFWEDIFLGQPFVFSKNNKISKNLTGIYFDLREFPFNYQSVYKNSDVDKNIYQALVDPIWKEQIQFPKQKYALARRPGVTAKLLKKFLIYNPNISKHLEEKDLVTLKNIYHKDADRISFLKKFKMKDDYQSRRKPRYATNMLSRMVIDDQMFSATCYEVSEEGLCLLTPFRIEREKKIGVKINLNTQESIYIKAEVVWCSRQKIGLKIDSEYLMAWYSIIQNIQEEVHEGTQSLKLVQVA